MIEIKQNGDFGKVTAYLEKLRRGIDLKTLEQYGKQGVEALRVATPVDTGLTAASWSYQIVKEKDRIAIEFHNSNINDHVNIALILQYGHGTGTGGWVEGRDYINPAIQPIFDQLADDAWKEVVK